MRKEGASPFQLSSAIANNPEAVRDLHQAVPEVLSWTEGLWKDAGDVAQIHAEDTAGLKAVFGGETFPQGYKNVVSSPACTWTPLSYPTRFSVHRMC